MNIILHEFNLKSCTLHTRKWYLPKWQCQLVVFKNFVSQQILCNVIWMWLTFGPILFRRICSLSFSHSHTFSIFQVQYIQVLIVVAVRALLFECISCSSFWRHFNIYLLCSIISFTFTCIYIWFNTTISRYFFFKRFMRTPDEYCCWCCCCCCWWIAPIHLFRFAWLTSKFTLSINKILFSIFHFYSIQIPFRR